MILKPDATRAACWRPLAKAGVAISLVVIGCGARQPPPSGPPVVDVEPEVCDLGTIDPERAEATTAEFRVKNQGVDPLRLLELITSCRCARVNASTAELASGQEGFIRAQVRPDRAEPGEASALVQLVCNDPVRPRLPLRIIWKVRHLIEVDPPEIEFPSLLPNGTARLSAKVAVDATLASKKLELLAPERTDGGIQCSLRKADADGAAGPTQAEGNYRLDVEVRAGDEAGWQHATIALQFSDEARPRLVVPVRWQCVPKVRVLPAVVYFGKLRPGQTVERSVRLEFSEGSPPGVNTRCQGGGLTVTPAEEGKSKSEFVVTLRAPDSAGVCKGTIEFVFGNGLPPLVARIIAVVAADSGGSN